MPDKVIAASLKLDGDAANTSVKSFKAQLKEATNELHKVADTFGLASKEAENAAKKVASLKDAIGDAKALAETFNPDKKFVAFGGAIQGVTSGFSALNGAVGLFGAKGKEMEDVLLKVQSAMALQQGISGIAGAIDSFKLLANIIVKNVVAAFSTLKGAIAATGIGLVAVAVGVLVANFDKLKEALGVANKEQELLNETMDDFKKGAQDAVEETNKVKVAFDQAKVGVIGKKEALKVYNDTLGDSFGKAKSLAEAEKLYTDKADVYIKIMGLKAQANALFAKSAEQAANGITAANEDQTSFFDKAKTGLLQYLGQTQAAADVLSKAQTEGAAAAKKKADDNAKALLDAGEKLATEAQGLAKDNKIKLTEIDKGAIAAQKAGMEELRKAQQENALARIKDEEDNAKQKEEFDYQNSLRSIKALQISEDLKSKLVTEAAIKRNLDLAKIEEDFETKKATAYLKANLKKAQHAADQEQVMYDNAADLATQRLEEKQKRDKYYDDLEYQTEIDFTAQQAAQADARRAIAEKEFEHKMSLANATASGLNAVADIIGNQTAVGKTLAVAASLINTYTAITGQLRAFSTVPVPGYAIVQAIATGLAGFAAVKNILKVQVPGKSGGTSAAIPSLSATAPLAPSVPQNVTTQLDANAINQTNNAAVPVQAYVVEAQGTDARERITRLNRAARLGG